MKLKILSRVAAVLALTLSLVACVEADIEVLGEDSARMTVAIYTARAGATAPEADFCDEEGATLTTVDDNFVCTLSKEGSFADLLAAAPGEDAGSQPTITSAGPGLVRVEFPMGGVGEPAPPEVVAAMAPFFTHPMVITVRGKEIVESNMTVSGDKHAASQTIDVVSAMKGDVTIPATLYAIVKVN